MVSVTCLNFAPWGKSRRLLCAHWFVCSLSEDFEGTGDKVAEVQALVVAVPALGIFIKDKVLRFSQYVTFQAFCTCAASLLLDKCICT